MKIILHFSAIACKLARAPRPRLVSRLFDGSLPDDSTAKDACFLFFFIVCHRRLVADCSVKTVYSSFF